MKKFLAVLFIAIIACFVFVGCNSSGGQTPEGSSTPPTEQTPAEPEQPPSDEQPDQEEITKMYLTVNGNKFGSNSCEKACPQHLPIRDLLKDVAKEFEK